jgi:hypothetical protein
MTCQDFIQSHNTNVNFWWQEDSRCWVTADICGQTSVRFCYGINTCLANVENRVSSLYIQQDTTLHDLFISGNCSTCFEWYFHPSSGAHTTVSTASRIVTPLLLSAAIVEELEQV